MGWQDFYSSTSKSPINAPLPVRESTTKAPRADEQFGVRKSVTEAAPVEVQALVAKTLQSMQAPAATEAAPLVMEADLLKADQPMPEPVRSDGRKLCENVGRFLGRRASY